ncbi:methionine aminotransferase [Flavihumibacter sp. CACIAM 22H1]|uniref:methionine aminotransferase n=1 Tax=Flavihumibacter sp. CACIAM 22H1 TaxID=1812911 RepID=UPI0007A91788|nr:methionine aminotransferase [Flavihumibacter sp. CACIAM 22H1]KYP13068.1 MAG: aminotransferase [Flavihumibacter sp. CACIAM 22H1]
MQPIVSKLPGKGTTIFTTMSALASQYKAINLGQGFPDFPMDQALTNAVNAAMQQGYNQYAPMAGWLPLRETLAEKIAFLYQQTVHPDTEITITPGGTYAIFTALTALLQPGDEVIVLEPAYDSYVPAILANNAVPVLVPLHPHDFSIPWEAIRAALTTRTRAIIINSPHNPSGTTWSETDMRLLEELVLAHQLYLVSDEVYEHLVFDNALHQSVLRFPALLKRSFVCFSFGKTFHCTGWKIGYCVAPEELMTEFRKIHQYNCFSVHTPSQVGITEFLQNRSSYLQLGAFLQEKRDYFFHLMKSTRFTLLPSKGSYFCCAGYERISELADHDFARLLTCEHGVATIPVSAFYQHGKPSPYIRFCFAKKNETLEAAVEKLSLV